MLALALQVACRRGEVAAPPQPSPASAGLDRLFLRQGSVCASAGGAAQCWSDLRASDRSRVVGFLGPCAIDADGRVRCEGREPRPLPEPLDLATLHTSASACASDDAGRFACLDHDSMTWSTPLAAHGVRATSGSPGEGCLVDRDGVVRCWQDRGSAESRPLASLVPDAPPAVALDPTSEGSGGCAIAATGETLCWSTPTRPCGPGDTPDERGECRRLALEHPPPRELGAALAISSSGRHTCARLADGRVACWGENCEGQLGRGDRGDHGEAQAVPGLADVIAIDTAGRSSCALTGAGDVWCWGRGPWASRPAPERPVRVREVAGAVALAVGPHQSCAVTGDGAVWCWGRWEVRGNFDPCLPHGPRRIAGLGRATGVALDDRIGCAIESDGGLRCWAEPVAPPWVERPTLSLPGPTSSVALADDICAVQEAGRVRCWTVARERGTLSVRASGEVVLPDPASRVVGAYPLFCALTRAGEVHCWDLPEGWPTQSAAPERRATNASQLALTTFPEPALCWRTRAGAVECTGAAPPRPASLAGETTIAAMTGVVCGLRSDGAIVCDGELDERLGASAPPRRGTTTIALDTPSVDLGFGDDHGCALGRDGHVRCWGRRAAEEGQLGDGVEPFSRVPVRMARSRVRG